MGTARVVDGVFLCLVVVYRIACYLYILLILFFFFFLLLIESRSTREKRHEGAVVGVCFGRMVGRWIDGWMNGWIGVCVLLDLLVAD